MKFFILLLYKFRGEIRELFEFIFILVVLFFIVQIYFR
jgi:hypothetical protein